MKKNRLQILILIFSFAFIGLLQTADSIFAIDSDGRVINVVSIVTVVQPDPNPVANNPGIFSYIFEACAGNQDIQGPEVILVSDVESKKVKLSHNIKANQCEVSLSKITATTPDDIRPFFVDRGGMSKAIQILDDKMSEIKDKLQNERDALKEYTKLPRDSPDFHKNISKTTSNIENLRTELDDMREIYFRTILLLRN